MNLPPIVQPPYTDEQRQLIASYLLHMRAGTLSALSSSSRKIEIDSAIGVGRERQYYTNAESYSRFLLYWVGYQVRKNGMYEG